MFAQKLRLSSCREESGNVRSRKTRRKRGREKGWGRERDGEEEQKGKGGGKGGRELVSSRLVQKPL